MRAERRVYSEFLTNGAVAWFTAGIIAPLFTRSLGYKDLLAIVISMISCYVFLRIACYFGKEGK